MHAASLLQSVLMRHAPEFARVHAEAGNSFGLWRVQTIAVRDICLSERHSVVIYSYCQSLCSNACHTISAILSLLAGVSPAIITHDS
jgi:hypothetical protein